MLRTKIREEREVQIKVSGCSMTPNIKDGTKIIVSEKEVYELGDILVFSDVVGKKINVHRLVMKYNGFYYCKGDNSFAIEKITFDNIIGAVIFQDLDGVFIKPPKPTRQFIHHSLKVGFEFFKMGFDREKILNNEIYMDYKAKYLLK